jgi:hypothetical protein
MCVSVSVCQCVCPGNYTYCVLTGYMRTVPGAVKLGTHTPTRSAVGIAGMQSTLGCMLALSLISFIRVLIGEEPYAQEDVGKLYH